MKYIALVLLIGIYELVEPLHPIHLSITEIFHNKQEKRMEISQRIFIDDLETILYENYREKTFIGTKRQSQNTDSLMQRYLSKRFEIYANGKKQQLYYLGHEVEEEVVWVYWEAPLRKVKKLAIRNAILVAKYEDQKNMMHIKVNDKTRSVILDSFSTQWQLDGKR